MAAALAAPVAAAAQGTAGDPARVDAGRDAPEAGGIRDLVRLPGLVDLDGLVDEAAWAEVPTLPLTMYEPTYRGETGRRLWLKVAYDDQALYVAARFYHDDPKAIRAFTLTR
ncbi:MAG TPA: hypothetical protein VLA43_11945, partial [Longimicrobiales bacterium]|nr:hypothetical protein [Longimicrobiales bacterium]